jgi:hypothetical protein
MESQTLKWRVAAIAACGIVAIGALVEAIGQEQTTTATGTMSTGATTTSSTPVLTPQTTLATPPVKAKKPKGF